VLKGEESYWCKEHKIKACKDPVSISNAFMLIYEKGMRVSNKTCVSHNVFRMTKCITSEYHTYHAKSKFATFGNFIYSEAVMWRRARLLRVP
jgi:hypothetical protein